MSIEKIVPTVVSSYYVPAPGYAVVTVATNGAFLENARRVVRYEVRAADEAIAAALIAMGWTPPKCDGDHPAPACASPGCWRSS